MNWIISTIINDGIECINVKKINNSESCALTTSSSDYLRGLQIILSNPMKYYMIVYWQVNHYLKTQPWNSSALQDMVGIKLSKDINICLFGKNNKGNNNNGNKKDVKKDFSDSVSKEDTLEILEMIEDELCCGILIVYIW